MAKKNLAIKHNDERPQALRIERAAEKVSG
jgi:hypothetical protein